MLGFLMPLGVTLASLAQTHEQGEAAVTVLHDGLGAPDRAMLMHGLAGRLEVTWRQIDPEVFDGVHHTPHLTRASLFRLLLPELLPEEFDTVIYLDADVVVVRTLRPVWEIDLAGHEVAAVRDAGAPFAAGPLGTDWRSLGLEPGDPMFNSGLLVIPLERWRSAGVSRRAMDILRMQKPRWGDQDALNAVLRRRWKELPRHWNLQTPDASGTGLAWALWPADVEQALKHTSVIHYTECDKPWHAGSRHPLADHCSSTLLDSTAWGGWRPPSGSRRLYRRIGSRMRRSLESLSVAAATRRRADRGSRLVSRRSAFTHAQPWQSDEPRGRVEQRRFRRHAAWQFRGRQIRRRILAPEQFGVFADALTVHGDHRGTPATSE